MQLNNTKEYIMSYSTDFDKVKEFLDKCIKTIESGETAYIHSGYAHSSVIDSYNSIIQEHSRDIVDKLYRLGYGCITNHGHGCYDWKFFKKIAL